MLAELCNDCGNEMYTWHECEDGVYEDCLEEQESIRPSLVGEMK